MKTMLIAATAALAGTAALAQTATPPVAPVAPVRPMADGVMTRTEVVEKVRNHFSRFDADKDGSISSEEMSSFRGRLGHRKLAEGATPRVRIHEGPMRDPGAAFDRLDTNKDGAISRDEFTKAREQRIEKRIVMREKIKDGLKLGEGEHLGGNVYIHRMDRRGAKDGRLGAMRMHRRGGLGGARVIVMADTDKDGRITLTEAETLALQHFDQMDANRDGQVTREERGNRREIMIKEIRKKTPDAG